MSDKLIRVAWEHDTPVDGEEGQFYWADEVDAYIEELHKKIKALEERVEVGCDSEEYF